MTDKRKRVIELVTKVTGSADLKRVEGQLRKIDKSTAKANKQLASMSKRLKGASASVAGLATSFGLLLGAGALGGVIRATIEQEKAVKQLNTVLESTGSIAGKTSEELQDLASSLQEVTTFGDEAIIGAESILLTFTKIGGVNFDRTLRAVLDLSTAMDQDLKTSVVQLGKALNDPIANLGALSRTGIQFSKDQKEVIKALAETGRIAEAQIIILEELETQFGNSAEAARETLGGALKGLKNAFGDLFEAENTDGAKSLTDSVNELSDIFSDPEFKDSVQKVTADILKLTSTGVTTMANFTNIVGFLKDELLALYGVVDSADIARLLERQADLQDRINRTGFLGAIQNTTELKRQLDEVNKQLDEAYAKVNANKPIVITAPPKDAPKSAVVGSAPPADEGKLSNIQVIGPENIKFYETVKKAIDARAEQLTELEQIYESLYPDAVAYRDEVIKLNKAVEAGLISQDAYDKKLEEAKGAYETAIEGSTLATEAVAIFESTFQTAVDGVASGTQSMSDAFESMAKSILLQVAKLAAIRGIGNLLSGQGGFLGQVGTALLGSEKGNAFSGGKHLTAYAKGGVLSGPTVFPMANGAGIAGEAGPEAVLPLSRMSNGNLGVESSGMNVVINNNASGVEVRPRQTEDGLTIDVVMSAVSQAVRRGGNEVSESFEASYALNRGRAVYGN